MRGGGGKICDWSDVGEEGGGFRMTHSFLDVGATHWLGTEKQNRVRIINLRHVESEMPSQLSTQRCQMGSWLCGSGFQL